MTKALFLIISSFLPGILLAQIGSDEASKACDDKFFTRVETLPDFKKGKAAFEDSLATYLKKQNAFPTSGIISYIFIVTTESKICDIKQADDPRKAEDAAKYEAQIEKALISIPAALWLPARQNGRSVCAYVGLTLEFSKNMLTAKIVEPASLQSDF
jgi:hypothetical protein